jgi:hypothetical protein
MTRYARPFPATVLTIGTRRAEQLGGVVDEPDVQSRHCGGPIDRRAIDVTTSFELVT